MNASLVLLLAGVALLVPSKIFSILFPGLELKGDAFALLFLFLLPVIFLGVIVGVDRGRIRAYLTYAIFILVTGLALVVNMFDENIGGDPDFLSWLELIGLMGVCLVKIPGELRRPALQLLLYGLAINVVAGLVVKSASLLFGIGLSSYHSDKLVAPAFGVIGGPIVLGLAVAIILSAYTASTERKGRTPNVLAILLTVYIGSRTGLLGVLIVSFGSFVSRLNWRRMVLMFLVFLGLVGGVSYLTAQTEFRVLDFSFKDNSSLLRFNALIWGAQQSVETPFVGSGPGMVFPRTDREFQATKVQSGGAPVLEVDGVEIPTEPHNQYLLVAVEYGYPAAVMLAVYLFQIYKLIGQRLAWTTSMRSIRQLLAFFLTLGLLTSSVFSFNMRFGLVLALLIAVLLSPEKGGA